MLLFAAFAFYCVQIRSVNRAHRTSYTVLLLACVCIFIRGGLRMGNIIEENTFP